MARRPKVSERRPPEKSSIDVVPVVDARSLVTIAADSFVWGHDLELAGHDLPPGSLVRLEPPESATDDAVERVSAAAVARGASAVVVLARRKAAVVVQSKQRKPHAKARDVVEQLVDASNVDDKDALRLLARVVMAGCGL